MLSSIFIEHFNIGGGRVDLQQVFVLIRQLSLLLLVVKGAEVEVKTSYARSINPLSQPHDAAQN